MQVIGFGNLAKFVFTATYSLWISLKAHFLTSHQAAQSTFMVAEAS